MWVDMVQAIEGVITSTRGLVIITDIIVGEPLQDDLNI